MKTFRIVAVAALSATTLGACATKGFVRKGLEDQRVALSGEMTAATTAERNERMGADSAIRGDVAKVAADLAALKAELTTMRTDFNAKIAVVEGAVTFALPVHFGFDNAAVRTEDQAALDKFASVVNKYYHGAQITVEGYADPAGSTAYNLKLSKERADAVRDFVASKGVDPSLLKTVGLGETRLIRKGAKKDDAGAELNRRVSFTIDTPTETTVAALSMR
jgi:outer membrane protein OmpA-like peptidoglycan-associated protein